MKSNHVVLSVLASLFAGAALAGGGPYPEPAIPAADPVFKSRADVVAELRAAERMGLLTIGEEDVRMPRSAEVRTRAEVVAELRAAERLGLLTTGEEDMRSPTPGEARMIAEAGRRAAESERLTADGKHAD